MGKAKKTKKPSKESRREKEVRQEAAHAYRTGMAAYVAGRHEDALPLLRKAVARGAATAAIVNISSVYGKVGGAQFAAYSATKGAVRALSKAVAIEPVSYTHLTLPTKA